MKLLISFFIALLMGMGVGGGGLFVIYLTLCLGYEQALGQGTNLLFFLIAGASSLIFHLKRRKIVPWQVTIMIIFGCLGSIIFARLLNFTDTGYAKIALGTLLFVSGAVTLYKSFNK